MTDVNDEIEELAKAIWQGKMSPAEAAAAIAKRESDRFTQGFALALAEAAPTSSVTRRALDDAGLSLGDLAHAGVDPFDFNRVARCAGSPLRLAHDFGDSNQEITAEVRPMSKPGKPRRMKWLVVDARVSGLLVVSTHHTLSSASAFAAKEQGRMLCRGRADVGDIIVGLAS